MLIGISFHFIKLVKITHHLTSKSGSVSIWFLVWTSVVRCHNGHHVILGEKKEYKKEER